MFWLFFVNAFLDYKKDVCSIYNIDCLLSFYFKNWWWESPSFFETTCSHSWAYCRLMARREELFSTAFAFLLTALQRIPKNELSCGLDTTGSAEYGVYTCHPPPTFGWWEGYRASTPGSPLGRWNYPVHLPPTPYLWLVGGLQSFNSRFLLQVGETTKYHVKTT